MRFLKLPLAAAILPVLLLSGCENNPFQQKPPAPVTVGSVPAVRLNFRFEPDVPAPTADPNKATSDDRNEAIQADFDVARPQEILDKVVTSPDKKRVAVVYHKVTDYNSEYRIDMYSAEGKLLKKVTSDAMAVHFPDTIVWSPDSLTLAFVAMTRIVAPDLGLTPLPTPTTPATIDGNTSTAADTNTAPIATAPSAPTPAAPTGILTYRTEQIYTCTSEGTGTKAITQNEGLIYFYYAWSPDSTMLVSLAATSREWKYLEVMTGSKGEAMVPQGRLRVVEKNGRERRLDDNLTAVRPVWSSDSTKIAAAFETQVRIYDAAGVNPTQAAIPLRNQLLISSKVYDQNQQRIAQGANTDTGTELPQPTPEELSTLPDEKLLVSYNPIIEIAWTSDDMLYLQTAYLKRMKNEADNVRSFSRWHRLIFTAQPTIPSNKP